MKESKCYVCGGTESLSVVVAITKYFGFVREKTVCKKCIEVYEKIRDFKDA